MKGFRCNMRRFLTSKGKFYNVNKMVNILIIEPVNLELLMPGGIDTFVRDTIYYSKQLSYTVFGNTNEKSKIGKLQRLKFGEKEVNFRPISTINKFSHKIPHSFIYVFSIQKVDWRFSDYTSA
jgi:hypothetical protein